MNQQKIDEMEDILRKSTSNISNPKETVDKQTCGTVSPLKKRPFHTN
jgi:hypothetical protein